MDIFMASVTIEQLGNTGPATVTYRNESLEVAYVIDAEGRIGNFVSIQYLAMVVASLLQAHGMTTNTVAPSVTHIAATAEKCVTGAFMQVGALLAEVGRDPELGKTQLQANWNYPGWLTLAPANEPPQ